MAWRVIRWGLSLGTLSVGIGSTFFYQTRLKPIARLPAVPAGTLLATRRPPADAKVAAPVPREPTAAEKEARKAAAATAAAGGGAMEDPLAPAAQAPPVPEYRDTFAVSLELPPSVLGKIVALAPPPPPATSSSSSSAASSPLSPAKLEAQALTTQFARSFFDSASFNCERWVLKNVLRIGDGGPPPAQRMALHFLPGDKPVHDAFTVVAREPDQVLLRWGLKPGVDGYSFLQARRVVLGGLATESPRAARAQLATHAAGFQPLARVQFRFGSSIFAQSAEDDGLMIRLHRLYARVCVYFALRRLLQGEDPVKYYG